MRRRLLAVAIGVGICVGMSSAAAAGVFEGPHERGAPETASRAGPTTAAPTPGAPAVEYDCTGPTGSTRLAVEPSSIVIACADGGVGAEDLTWSSWQDGAAHGRGIIWWHVCSPDCAASTTSAHYRAKITLRGVVRTPKGPVFSVMSVAYTTTGPRRGPTGSPITEFTLAYPGE